MLGASLSLSVGKTPPVTGALGMVIDDVDTEANIHSTSPTNPTGEYTIAFGSDTYDLYVWTGTVWMKFSND